MFNYLFYLFIYIIAHYIFFLSARSLAFLILEKNFKTSSTKTTGADTPNTKILYMIIFNIYQSYADNGTVLKMFSNSGT